MNNIYDVIIIGGGPAGLTAGIYCSRYGLSTLILEKEVCGGQINYSSKVDNIPGYIEVKGIDFTTNLTDQAEKLGCEIEYYEATNIQKNLDNNFEISTNDEVKFIGKTVILAVGCKHRVLGLPNEEQLIGNGIHFCATCDGAFYKDKDVVIIGGGNSAMTEAEELAKICKSVTILQNLPELTADKASIDRVTVHDNVSVFCNIQPTGYAVNNGKLIGIHYNTGEFDFTTFCDGIFLCIGMIPNTDFISSVIKLNSNNYIIIDECNKFKTNMPGIFAAGDCTITNLRQVVTACADGAKAAASTMEYLSNGK